MHTAVIGINYKSSDLHLRELVAKASMQCFGGESKTSERLSCVLLATCNRTEVYYSTEDLAEGHSEILHVLRSRIHYPFEHKLYSYFGEDCFTHLAMVTAGLDSVIIAESEIQRQVKEAYENACLYRSLSSSVHFMFQKSLKIGKSIRSSSFLTQRSVSLEKTIFDLCQMLSIHLKTASILMIGNSEINRKILSFFKNREVHDITLCTRGLVSAQELAHERKISLLEWSGISSWHKYNVVICGSNQQNYLITHEEKRHPLTANRVIFDLGLPRNVDPKITRQYPDSTLLNIEQIGQLIDKKQRKHLEEIIKCEEAARTAVKRQSDLFQQKTAYEICIN